MHVRRSGIKNLYRTEIGVQKFNILYEPQHEKLDSILMRRHGWSADSYSIENISLWN